MLYLLERKRDYVKNTDYNEVIEYEDIGEIFDLYLHPDEYATVYRGENEDGYRNYYVCTDYFDKVRKFFRFSQKKTRIYEEIGDYIVHDCHSADEASEVAMKFNINQLIKQNILIFRTELDAQEAMRIMK